MRILISTFHGNENSNKLHVLNENLDLIHSFGAEFTNIKGVFVYGNEIYAAHKNKNNACSILIFNKDSYELIKEIELFDVLDIHSIRIRRNKIYIVSSGSNCVLVYSLNNPDKPKKVIRTNQSSVTNKDAIHLNSLDLTNNNEILLSGFGKKSEAGKWSDSRNGFIVKISQQNEGVVVKNIHHPHSILSIDDSLWYCESGTGRVYRDDLILIRDLGYTRGLHVANNGEKLFVGTSTPRAYQQQIINHFEPSGVHLYEKDKKTYKLKKTFHLRERGAEIYDIVEL